MSARGLQQLVGKAVVSAQFCAGLLSDRRAEALYGLELDAEETAAIIAIRADSLAEFAAQVEAIFGSPRLTASSPLVGRERVRGERA